MFNIFKLDAVCGTVGLTSHNSLISPETHESKWPLTERKQSKLYIKQHCVYMIGIKCQLKGLLLPLSMEICVFTKL